MSNKIKLIISLIGIIMQCQTSLLYGQSLSPQVIASAGGYVENTAGSLSYTIGETNTLTLSSATNMLTQGFQQPFRLTINLKAFIQGYYQGSGQMANVLYNEGAIANPGNETDTVHIELHQPMPPYAVAYETYQFIHSDGTVVCNGIGSVGQSYYIVIKHRNLIETWSANPITISEITNYDFTSGANKAYGDNQVEVEPNVWAMYSGDINQDENIDLLDIVLAETDISNFEFGYKATDINGDGNVDLLDSPTIETNVNGFIFSAHP